MQVVLTNGRKRESVEYLRKFVDGFIVIVSLEVSAEFVTSCLHIVDFEKIWPGESEAGRRSMDNLPQALFTMQSELSIAATVFDYHAAMFYKISEASQRGNLAKSAFEFATFMSNGGAPPNAAWSCKTNAFRVSWDAQEILESPTGEELVRFTEHTSQHHGLETCGAVPKDSHFIFSPDGRSCVVAKASGDTTGPAVDISICVFAKRAANSTPSATIDAENFVRNVLSEARDIFLRNSLWTRLRKVKPFGLGELREIMRVSRCTALEHIDERVECVLNLESVRWVNFCAHLSSVYKSLSLSVACKKHHHVLFIDNALVFAIRVAKQGASRPRIQVLHPTGFDTPGATRSLRLTVSDFVNTLCHFVWLNVL